MDTNGLQERAGRRGRYKDPPLGYRVYNNKRLISLGVPPLLPEG